ncbi:acetyl-CoA synthetase-like protein [Phellopilus nigrolimitatus]|nr:acetyl-CoA synthetase-like protein [Phellopilus nigrolimitatus]
MSPLVIPRRHGLQSATFTQPPLDESLSLPAIYDWQAEHSPKHPVFVYEDEPGSQRTILWEENVQGVHRATRFVRKAIGNPPASSSDGKAPVVAVLASADTITFASLLIGVMRTGWTVFPISTRNSPAAVTTLLTQTKTAHIFVSADSSMQHLADAALKELSVDNTVKKHKLPVFEDLYPVKGFDPSFTPEPLAEIDMDAPAVIFHSSGNTSLPWFCGSTAFPKPIIFVHRATIWTVGAMCFGEKDTAGTTWACHAAPMFHAMGMFVLLNTAVCGAVAAVFKPQSPPTVPNPVNFMESAISSKCDYIFSTPTFPETWSHESRYVEVLAKMKGVTYGGGPLSKEASSHLSSKGVALYTLYGSELDCLSCLALGGADCDYFKICPNRDAHFIDYGNNEFELVFLATDFYRPNVINTKINGRDGYATSDLLSPHPTKPGYWKVVGRTDDQIMHSTGEKTNPGPLGVSICFIFGCFIERVSRWIEKMLARDPLVSHAVFFGRGRFHCGVLVQPDELYAFDPADTNKLAEFRNRIWPTVEKMNEFAPTHSRIFKEMIIVASPSKPFPLTGKGTVRRQVTIKEYDDEIEAAYKAVDESAQDNIVGPENWSQPQVTEFVREIVLQTMKKENGAVADDADLFEHGLDSLQATWIRNTVLRVLRDSHAGVARKLSATFIYDYPTIARLAEYLSSSVSGTSVAPAGDARAKARELEALVAKYTTAFPTFVAGAGSGNDGNGDAVLLTGSTGSLGSNILAKLIQNKAVTRVYAMSRPSSDGVSVKERHAKAFERESLDVQLLDDARVSFVDGDAGHADFAIDAKLFAEVRCSTVSVNFNVAVTSFESNIRSVRNFIDFALGGHGATPARVLFISSIGVFSSPYISRPLVLSEEPLSTPDTAISTGYTESKWVSEHILQVATEKTPLSATVVRCGQMTGGPSGAWNTHEWFPSLIKSSIALGMLPDATGVVSWLTAHDAGGAVVDMLHAHDFTVNLVHPRPVPWSTVISAFSDVLSLPRVPYSTWLSALEAAQNELYSGGTPSAEAVSEAHGNNPALRLYGFFRAAEGTMTRVSEKTVEALGTALRFERAEAASTTLREVPQLGQVNVKTWVENWRASGFIRRA